MFQKEMDISFYVNKNVPSSKDKNNDIADF